MVLKSYTVDSVDNVVSTLIMTLQRRLNFGTTSCAYTAGTLINLNFPLNEKNVRPI